jgi:hypothetical protein
MHGLDMAPPVDNQKSRRVKMFILGAAILALMIILYPMLIGAQILDKSEIPHAKEIRHINSSAIERLVEALKQSPFVVASVFVMMTMIVLLSGGVILYGYYINKED